VRDLEPRARALCSRGEAAVACVQWGERHTTPQQLLRVEAYCDLRGVPLRAGDKFYLRAVGCVREGMPHGCHLHADWHMADDERQVGARALRREAMQEIEAFKVGPMRNCLTNR
jgi:hypothetical protein